MLTFGRNLGVLVTRGLRWAGSVATVLDVPAAIIGSLCRHKCPNGQGLVDRGFRWLFPTLTLHPRELGGMSLVLNPADIYVLLIYDELFISRIYDFSSVPFVPDTVIDCGAFTGFFSLLAKARYPTAQTVAFEPHPDNFAAMIVNFERNELKIDARNQAVSDKECEMSFSGDGVAGHITSEFARDGRQVEVVDLCKILTDLSPTRLLLKLDVEGEEELLIPAIMPLLPDVCAVFFESHNGEAGYAAIEQLFLRAGFAVHRNRSHGELYVDAVAIRSPLSTHGSFATTALQSD